MERREGEERREGRGGWARKKKRGSLGPRALRPPRRASPRPSGRASGWRARRVEGRRREQRRRRPRSLPRVVPARPERRGAQGPPEPRRATARRDAARPPAPREPRRLWREAHSRPRTRRAPPLERRTLGDTGSNPRTSTPTRPGRRPQPERRAWTESPGRSPPLRPHPTRPGTGVQRLTLDLSEWSSLPWLKPRTNGLG